jgi:molecular chaperone DnaK (HSP70)
MLQIEQRLQSYGKTITSYEPDKAVAMGAALVVDGTSYESASADSGNDFNASDGGSPASLGGESGSITVGDWDVTIRCTNSYGLVAFDANGNEFVGNIIFKDRDSKPIRKERTFGTAAPNQTSINLRVYENDSLKDDVGMTEDNNHQPYESCTVPLTPGLPQGAPISIVFDLDNSGILNITAVDLTNNISEFVVPVRHGGEAATAGMDTIKMAVLT